MNGGGGGGQSMFSTSKLNSTQCPISVEHTLRTEGAASEMKSIDFFCWFGDGYAICVLLRFVFYVGWIICLPLYSWCHLAMNTVRFACVGFAYDSTISCVPLFSCGVRLKRRIINIELVFGASGECRMEQCAGATKKANNGGILMTSVVNVVFLFVGL